MKLFECQNCGQLLYFENTRCESCGTVLGYMPDRESLSALTTENDGWLCPLDTPREPFRLCANATYDACNWLVSANPR